MIHLKHALAVALFAAAFGVQAQSLPQDHPLSGRFESEEFLNFWRSEGWAYTADQKEAMDCLSFGDLQPLQGQAKATVDGLLTNAFDPAQYAVNVAQNRHTTYCVDGAGVLVFFSIDRVKVLYDRAKKSGEINKTTRP